MKIRLDQIWTVLVFLFLCVIAALVEPNFMKADNWQGWLMAVTPVGMIACTMMLCLGSGDVDLSVGSTCALAGVVAAVLLRQTNNVLVSIGGALAAGILVGLVNGVIVAKFKVNPLIATLATMQVVRGAAFLTAPGGTSVGLSNDQFSALSKWKLWGFSGPIWYMFLFFVLFAFLLNRTAFGRNVMSVGGNAEASRLAGINVDAVRIWVFTLQGLMAAFAGVVLASRVSSGQPQAQNGLELLVIAGCVLGGVSLTGGIASMVGVSMGVFIMGVVQNAMSLRNIDTYWQMVTFGFVLLVAVLVDRIKASGFRGVSPSR